MVDTTEPLSDLARRYGAVYDVLRADTTLTLVALGADPDRVEEVADEWHTAHPTPQPHGPGGVQPGELLHLVDQTAAGIADLVPLVEQIASDLAAIRVATERQIDAPIDAGGGAPR